MANSAEDPVKQQCVDKLPKRFRGIKFGIQSVHRPSASCIAAADSLPARSNQDIANQAVLEVSNRLLYDIEKNRAPHPHGPLDPRLVRRLDATRHLQPPTNRFASSRAHRARPANAPPASTLFRTATATLVMSGSPSRPFTWAISDSSSLFCKKFARYAAQSRISKALSLAFPYSC